MVLSKKHDDFWKEAILGVHIQQFPHASLAAVGYPPLPTCSYDFLNPDETVSLLVKNSWLEILPWM